MSIRGSQGLGVTKMPQTDPLTLILFGAVIVVVVAGLTGLIVFLFIRSKRP